MLEFALGVVCTIIVGFISYLFFITGSYAPINRPHRDRLDLPPELCQFLLSGANGTEARSESCYALSLILKFIFQENKHTRWFRQWVLSKIKYHLAELRDKFALKVDLDLEDINFGEQVPIIHSIRVKSSDLNAQGEFRKLHFVIDVEYRGGFELNSFVQYRGTPSSFKMRLEHLRGSLLLMFERLPYAHWAFAFEKEPEIQLDLNCPFFGPMQPFVVPMFNNHIRRLINRKHVFPNFKCRDKPFFVNPLLQPTIPQFIPNNLQFDKHGLEVIVLNCTRLNKDIALNPDVEVFCTLELSNKLYSIVDSKNCHCFHIVVQPFTGDFGMVTSTQKNSVCVAEVTKGSLAEKSGFRKGDVIIGLNNRRIPTSRLFDGLLSCLGKEAIVAIEREIAEGYPIVFERPASAPPTGRASPVEPSNDANIDSTSLIDPAVHYRDQDSTITTLFDAASVVSSNVVFDTTVVAPENTTSHPQMRKFYSVDDVYPRDNETSNLRSVHSVPHFAKLTSLPPSSSTPRKPLSKHNSMETVETATEAVEQSFRHSSLSIDSNGPSTCLRQHTKSVSLDTDPFWGQSLVFMLRHTTKFLNVKVFAKTPGSDEPAKLLGYTSIYIPQIIYDSRQTLSKTFTQSFALRGEKITTMSNRPGFDPLLCFGEILLSFHEFPGNPQLLQQVDSMLQSESLLSPRNFTAHQWKPDGFKAGTISCQQCGKTVFSRCNRCSICGMAIHKKCVQNCCIPCIARGSPTTSTTSGPSNDANSSRVVTSGAINGPNAADSNDHHHSPSASVISDIIDVANSVPLGTPPSSTPSTDGRRFGSVNKEKMFSRVVRNVRNILPSNKKQALTSGGLVYVHNIIEEDFLNRLSGSTALRKLYFDPENSYNEAVVNNLRSVNRYVFADHTESERTQLADQQVCIIQEEVDKITHQRRQIRNHNSVEFRKVDMRLQALTILMLHYCGVIKPADDDDISVTSFE